LLGSALAEASAEAACAAAAVASDKSPGLLCNSSLTALSDDVTSPALHYIPALPKGLNFMGLGFVCNKHAWLRHDTLSLSPWHMQGVLVVHSGAAGQNINPRCASASTSAVISLYVVLCITPSKRDIVQSKLLREHPHGILVCQFNGVMSSISALCCHCAKDHMQLSSPGDTNLA